MRKHYTKTQRAELVDLVTSGRATPRAAAARLGVAESTAYYWLKREGRSLALAVPASGNRHVLAKAAPTITPTFARLVPAAEVCASITLRIGGVVIEVRPGFDHALLHDVVTALVERAA
jgi:transposase-like protein